MTYTCTLNGGEYFLSERLTIQLLVKYVCQAWNTNQLLAKRGIREEREEDIYAVRYKYTIYYSALHARQIVFLCLKV